MSNRHLSYAQLQSGLHQATLLTNGCINDALMVDAKNTWIQISAQIILSLIVCWALLAQTSRLL